MTDKNRNIDDKFIIWRDFKIAIGFFTRLPIKFDQNHAPYPFIKTVWAFPLAGFVIGLLAALIFAIADILGINIWIGAFLTIGATAIITGALHEDGLADFFDGIWGGDNAKRRLEIMRDSNIGTYGALALIIATGLKFSSIININMSYILSSLIAAHIFSRAILPIIMYHMDMAGKTGLAASFGKPNKILSLIALFIGVFAIIILLGIKASAIIIITISMVIFLMVRLVKNKIGGYNGDILGMIQQICEIIILICCSVQFSG